MEAIFRIDTGSRRSYRSTKLKLIDMPKVSDVLFEPVIILDADPFSSVIFEELPRKSATPSGSRSTTSAAAPAVNASDIDGWISDDVFWMVTEEADIMFLALWLEINLAPGNVCTDYAEYWAVRRGRILGDSGISSLQDPDQMVDYEENL